MTERHQLSSILRWGTYKIELTRINGVYTCTRLTKTKRESPKTNRKWGIHKKYYCPTCGKEKSSSAHSNSMCIDCYYKLRHKNSNCPSKKELEKLLKHYKNFSYVGKIFNVTDNAVRKWCKYYNLPYKTSDWKTK